MRLPASKPLSSATALPPLIAPFIAPLLSGFIMASGALAATANAAADNNQVNAGKSVSNINKAYPGVVQLIVDASDLDRKIFNIRASIPVQAGPLTLYFPEWLPGKHGTNSALNQLAGLRFSGNQQAIAWKRDPLNMYAFHLQIPAGVSQLNAEYQFLSPTEDKFGRVTMTPDIIGVQWNNMILYPAGAASDQIRIQPTLILPAGFQFGSALELAEKRENQGQRPSQNEFQFKPVTLEELVDSPVFAGKYFKRFDLNPGAKIPVHLNVVADKPESLNATPEQIAAHQALVQQASTLFGSQHYRHYDFLLSLSDEFSGIGLEHHQSSENGVRPGYFSDWAKKSSGRDLLAHEYTHSWNGKFRRPADLLTPHFNTPMQDSLLWVYEGQTQYWGYVLAARSGLMKQEHIRDVLANVAAYYDHQSGRNWRNLQDTTNNPVFVSRRSQAWSDFQRDEDYYREGALLWLEVDAQLRALSAEKYSLNDFAGKFFGVNNGSTTPLSYQLSDIISTLNEIQPFDWGHFLQERLEGLQSKTPTASLELAGWKLVYTEKPSEYAKATEDAQDGDFLYSLGFSLDKTGKITRLLLNSPAGKANILSGSLIIAVNGKSYKADALKSAITNAKTQKQAIELIVRHGEYYRTIRLDYFEGLKYPALVRNNLVPDRLSKILTPLK
ncbi:M61 family metallopeptidase [Undibacterium aquatile]|uniref:M61 family metallopeptidase n=1 Tax=Undibacterium aquatile TaxID=1537398 RepID=A0ABR6XDV0_9BURK|nr:M61 family metallopeptidase [Undibacterium aquatile]MBC3811074.1 M61 family metallopeptidase [Undibacterium aquatile]